LGGCPSAGVTYRQALAAVHRNEQLRGSETYRLHHIPAYEVSRARGVRSGWVHGTPLGCGVWLSACAGGAGGATCVCRRRGRHGKTPRRPLVCGGACLSRKKEIRKDLRPSAGVR
jgi:hypothetical protein